MKAKRAPSTFDSIVVITVLTTDSTRRDQIDRLIDKAFAKDPRIQVVRVVGYSPSAAMEQLTRAFETLSEESKA